MAAVSCVLSEDQFLCSICLEVFTDPVTTSCGHSFCKICLNKHWDNSNQCQCPVCKEDFSTRPQLKISTCLSEMVSQFKKEPQKENIVSSEAQAAEPRDVTCDLCSDPKLKALKSCLVCLASYCQSHLEPHVSVSRLMRHQLINPVGNMEDRICPEHDKPLELFCREDSQSICLQCTFSDHKSHNAVPFKEECEVKQAELKQMITERREKIQEIQRSVELSQKNADRETEEGVKVFNALIKCVEQSLDEFKHSIEGEHKEKEEEAAELIQELETEISELEKRQAQMEELSSSEDHLGFLQTFTSVNPAPSVKDWTEVTIRAPSYEGRVAKAVSELEDNELSQEIKKVFQIELKRVQQFAVEVTLDPGTAHPNLHLSYDLKQVHHSDRRNIVPDNDRRFSQHPCVVGKQKFSSGRSYFQVQVKEKTSWYLGMAKESIQRNMIISPKPMNGYWSISLCDNQYRAHDIILSNLHLKSIPQKIGVFVDYEEGLVSFYDVDTAALIYSFTNCSFTEDLLLLVNPGANKKGENSAPLKLTSVTI